LLIGYLLSGYVFLFMETTLGKHTMQIFKSPCKKPVRDHGAKVRFSGTTAAGAIPQPFFMVRRISAWNLAEWFYPKNVIRRKSCLAMSPQ